jgi:hypothetical protein
MKKQSDVVLNDVWDDMEGSQKVQALKQVVEIESTLASIKFTKFGSLYYKHDLPQSDSTTPFYVVGNGIAVHSTELGTASLCTAPSSRLDQLTIVRSSILAKELWILIVDRVCFRSNA